MLKREKRNEPLTRAEQILMSYLTKDSLISYNKIKEIYTSKRIGSSSYLRPLIASLIKKGQLLQIKKGLYYVTLGQGYDPFVLGQSLFGGYIGFSTALWLHGLKTEMPSTCYIVVYKGRKSKTIGNMHYQTVSLGKKCVGAYYRDKYFLSTRAKTFFDCFYMPKYAGGFTQLTQSLIRARLSDDEWDEFIRYLNDFASRSMLQRTGYILSLVRQEKKTAVPERVINWIRKKLKNKFVFNILDPSLRSKGRFIKEWGIYDNLGKERIIGR